MARIQWQIPLRLLHLCLATFDNIFLRIDDLDEVSSLSLGWLHLLFLHDERNHIKVSEFFCIVELLKQNQELMLLYVVLALCRHIHIFEVLFEFQLQQIWLQIEAKMLT